MDRQTATEEIKARWKEFYPADKSGKGIICPLCGSGSGKNGTGITEKPRSRNHFLKCWNGGCAFNRGGSVIDLFMMESGKDFAAAVDEMAARLNIDIAAGNPSFSGRPSAPSEPDTEPAEPPADFTEYYRQCRQNLLESAEAQAYLQQRGISIDLALKYFIGFDPAWISPTVRKNQQKKGSNWLPEAKPVIILPSTLQHYVARDIRPDLTDQQRHHQKMNEGTPGIFGLQRAFHSDAEAVFVTEGAFDALAIIEGGGTAIGLNSTSNAEKLLDYLEKNPTKATLIICLDNDESGRTTATRLKDGLQRLNITSITANVSGTHKDPNEALTADRAEFEAAVARAKAKISRPDNTAEYLDSLMAGEIECFKQAEDRKTGFANLDEHAGGLYPGLYVLAAISSLGKTTLALQMADQIAAAGHDVLFFSMEQSRLEMVSKSLSRLTAQANMQTAVNSLAIRRGYLPSQVTAAARQYKEQIGNRLSIIEGNFNCDIGYIFHYIRQYMEKNKGTAPIVFIDYLQILQPAAAGKSHNSKKDEIDLAVTELKRLSRELNLTIIVISSINRANYLTPFAFESLKESGGIEYTADVVWGLQLTCLDEPLFDEEKKIKQKRERIDKAKSDDDPRKIKFVCIKNRYGISSYNCYFNYYPKYDLFVPAPIPKDDHAGAKPFSTRGKGR